MYMCIVLQTSSISLSHSSPLSFSPIAFPFRWSPTASLTHNTRAWFPATAMSLGLAQSMIFS